MMHERGWLVGSVMSVLVVACAAGGELNADDDLAAGEDLDGSIVDARARDSATPPKNRDSGSVDAADTGSDGEDDASVADASDVIDAAPDTGTPLPPPLIYAHSATNLYRYDGTTLTNVGAIAGIGTEVAIDLAVDRNGQGYLTTFDGLYRIDLATGATTRIKAGVYSNSLSFVPVGTLDPNEEVLVTYEGATYRRIDTNTGNLTTLGQLGGGFESSGDIVSVAGGGTFVTVTPASCATNCIDSLVRINPQTGAMLRDYGTVGVMDVYGLAYWAGAFYGFTGSGAAFTLTWNGTQMVRANVALANPTGIWNGAASSTLAPATGPGGSGPPLN